MQNVSTIRRTTAAAIAALTCACQTHAQSLSFGPGCASTGDDRFKCRMVGLLNFLYIAAGILAFVLVIVIVLAIRTYRNRSARPEDDPLE